MVGSLRNKKGPNKRIAKRRLGAELLPFEENISHPGMVLEKIRRKTVKPESIRIIRSFPFVGLKNSFQSTSSP